MLFWSLMLLVLATIAGILGFAGGTPESSHSARVLFYLFCAGFTASVVLNVIG